MDTRTKEIQVGLTVIVAVAALIVGMLWFKNVSVSSGNVSYQVDFPSVDGLQLRDRVQVRGIRVGQVESYRIHDGFVRVEIGVEEGVGLGQDADIYLGTKGIVGEIVIDIDPGSGPAVPPGHVFQGRAIASIAAMTDAADGALKQMSALAGKVDTLLTAIQDEGKLVETMQTAHEAVTRIGTLVEDNEQRLGRTLSHMETASRQLAELMESGKVEQTLEDASSSMARADSLMASLESSTAQLGEILTKLNEGDGSAAKLLNDPALYARADSTLTAVQRLTDAMRRNPKKYFKVNLVDF